MSFLRLLYEIRTPFLTTLFRFCTLFGEEATVFVLICCIYWCVDRALAYKIGVVFFISGMLVQSLKITLRVDRPWIIDSGFKPVLEAVGTATGYSFPSGHTQAASAVYLTIAASVKNRPLRAALVVITAGVAFSRMYLGVHTPADVAAGILLSVVSLTAVTMASRIKTDPARADIAVASVMVILSVACLIYAAALYETGVIELKNVSDCAKAAGAGIGFGIAWYTERKFIRFDVHMPKKWMQAVKLIIGIAVLLAIKEGLKILLGDGIAADAFRYCAVVVWVMAIYPLLIKRASESLQKRKIC